MTTIVALAISSIMLHDYCVLFVMRTVKIYSLSNFEVYNAVLLTTITMLYINLQNLSTSCKLLPLNIFPIRFFIFYFFFYNLPQSTSMILSVFITWSSQECVHM